MAMRGCWVWFVNTQIFCTPLLVPLPTLLAGSDAALKLRCAVLEGTVLSLARLVGSPAPFPASDLLFLRFCLLRRRPNGSTAFRTALSTFSQTGDLSHWRTWSFGDFCVALSKAHDSQDLPKAFQLALPKLLLQGDPLPGPRLPSGLNNSQFLRAHRVSLEIVHVSVFEDLRTAFLQLCADFRAQWARKASSEAFSRDGDEGDKGGRSCDSWNDGRIGSLGPKVSSVLKSEGGVRTRSRA